MEIRANFNERVVVHSHLLEWVKSPMPGVDRRPLDRVGEEVARATSIVRYAPGSHFSPHVHTGGEEFVVLSGVFQDEHGDFPAGSYIRNPPQSKHTPGSDEGCIIFVKLWQFQLDDRTHVRKKLNELEYTQVPNNKGIRESLLYRDDFETVTLLQLEPNTELSIDATGGLEVLVLEGSITEQNDALSKHSWLRLPMHSQLYAQSGDKGATLWIKNGNLVDVEAQIKRVRRA